MLLTKEEGSKVSTLVSDLEICPRMERYRSTKNLLNFFDLRARTSSSSTTICDLPEFRTPRPLNVDLLLLVVAMEKDRIHV
jgi:hypothetical protein